MLSLRLGLGLTSNASGNGGQPPALTNNSGTITATGGYPPPPTLTNNTGTITATEST
jgi:hypothetical protein